MTVTPAAVPVVDLADATTADGRRRVTAAIDDALGRVGFMALTGHGVSGGLLDRALSDTRTFFDLPTEEKLRTVSPTGANRGFKQLGSEAQAQANGLVTPPDLSETFAAGREEPPPGAHPAEAAVFPANVWPDRPTSLRSTYLDLLGVMDDLAATVLRLMAPALGVADGFFDERIGRTMASVRANHYPARATDPEDGQFRGGAHTDYGSITFLVSDGVPGLEIQGADDVWRPVARVPGALHVNTGDMLAHWSGGRWRSTRHRVVPPPGGPPHPQRISLVYFHSPDHDTVVSPVGRPGAEPITAGEFLSGKLRRLYDVAR